jgi:hypothetical protein
MAGWAIKIFDGDLGAGARMGLELARERGAGVEVALYAGQGFPKDVEDRLREMSIERPGSVALHASHGAVALADWIGQSWSWEAYQEALGVSFGQAHGSSASRLTPEAFRLAGELAWARSVGARSVVIHLERAVGPLGESWWKSQDPARLAQLSAPALRAARGLGARLVLEKTFESREWFDAFYQRAFELGLSSSLGFAFDLGHSRVWEPEPLGGWLDSMSRWKIQGFELHFHLHGNPGDFDRHATLAEAQAQGWLDPDPKWAPDGALPELERIVSEFGEGSMLVLENSTDQAREALGWAELALGASGARKAA